MNRVQYFLKISLFSGFPAPQLLMLVFSFCLFAFLKLQKTSLILEMMTEKDGKMCHLDHPWGLGQLFPKLLWTHPLSLSSFPENCLKGAFPWGACLQCLRILFVGIWTPRTLALIQDNIKRPPQSSFCPIPPPPRLPQVPFLRTVSNKASAHKPRLPVYFLDNLTSKLGGFGTTPKVSAFHLVLRKKPQRFKCHKGGGGEVVVWLRSTTSLWKQMPPEVIWFYRISVLTCSKWGLETCQIIWSKFEIQTILMPAHH